MGGINTAGNIFNGCVLSPDAPDNGDLEIEIILPREYQLSQNYPNPFNPVTTIEYAIPENTHLRLTIFDIRGRKVTDLYNGYKAAGYYATRWNASYYASGIYFIRMQTDSFVETKKMTLLK